MGRMEKRELMFYFGNVYFEMLLDSQVEMSNGQVCSWIIRYWKSENKVTIEFGNHWHIDGFNAKGLG